MNDWSFFDKYNQISPTAESLSEFSRAQKKKKKKETPFLNTISYPTTQPASIDGAGYLGKATQPFAGTQTHAPTMGELGYLQQKNPMFSYSREFEKIITNLPKNKQAEFAQAQTWWFNRLNNEIYEWVNKHIRRPSAKTQQIANKASDIAGIIAVPFMIVDGIYSGLLATESLMDFKGSTNPIMKALGKTGQAIYNKHVQLVKLKGLANDYKSALNIFKKLGQQPDTNGYRNLIKTYHPDMNPGYQELAQQINDAYGTIEQVNRLKKAVGLSVKILSNFIKTNPQLALKELPSSIDVLAKNTVNIVNELQKVDPATQQAFGTKPLTLSRFIRNTDKYASKLTTDFTFSINDLKQELTTKPRTPIEPAEQQLTLYHADTGMGAFPHVTYATGYPEIAKTYGAKVKKLTVKVDPRQILHIDFKTPTKAAYDFHDVNVDGRKIDFQLLSKEDRDYLLQKGYKLIDVTKIDLDGTKQKHYEVVLLDKNLIKNSAPIKIASGKTMIQRYHSAVSSDVLGEPDYKELNNVKQSPEETYNIIKKDIDKINNIVKDTGVQWTHKKINTIEMRKRVTEQLQIIKKLKIINPYPKDKKISELLNQTEQNLRTILNNSPLQDKTNIPSQPAQKSQPIKEAKETFYNYEPASLVYLKKGSQLIDKSNTLYTVKDIQKTSDFADWKITLKDQTGKTFEKNGLWVAKYLADTSMPKIQTEQQAVSRTSVPTSTSDKTEQPTAQQKPAENTQKPQTNNVPEPKRIVKKYTKPADIKNIYAPDFKVSPSNGYTKVQKEFFVKALLDARNKILKQSGITNPENIPIFTMKDLQALDKINYSNSKNKERILKTKGFVDNNGRRTPEGQAIVDISRQKAEAPGQFIYIKVPDDGEFTIPNNINAISAWMDALKVKPASTNEPTVKLTKIKNADEQSKLFITTESERKPVPLSVDVYKFNYKGIDMFVIKFPDEKENKVYEVNSGYLVAYAKNRKEAALKAIENIKREGVEKAKQAIQQAIQKIKMEYSQSGERIPTGKLPPKKKLIEELGLNKGGLNDSFYEAVKKMDLDKNLQAFDTRYTNLHLILSSKYFKPYLKGDIAALVRDDHSSYELETQLYNNQITTEDAVDEILRMWHEVKRIANLYKQNNINKTSTITSTSKQDILRIKQALQKRGVKKDALADSIDKIEEILQYDKNAQIDNEGFITLYHRTTLENARRIIQTNTIKGKEALLYFGTEPEGYISGYGKITIKVKIPVEKTEIDDEFENEVHLTVKNKDRKYIQIEGIASLYKQRTAISVEDAKKLPELKAGMAVSSKDVGKTYRVGSWIGKLVEFDNMYGIQAEYKIENGKLVKDVSWIPVYPKNKGNKPGYMSMDLGSEIIDSLKELFHPEKQSEKDLKYNTLNAIRKLEIGENLAKRLAVKTRDSLLKRIGKPNKVFLKIVDDWLDQPDKFQELYDTLPEKYKELGILIKQTYKRLGEYAKENDILEELRDNYTMHIYKDNENILAKQLFPSGGKLGTKFRYARARIYNTKEEAIAHGLHPIDNPILKVSIYTQQLFLTLNNKEFVQQLLPSLVDKETGLPAVMRRPKSSDKEALSIYNNVYEELQNRNLSQWMWLKSEDNTNMMVKIPLKAHPKVAQIINSYTKPHLPPHGFVKYYLAIRALVKRGIFFNPMIHGVNIEGVRTAIWAATNPFIKRPHLNGQELNSIERYAINSGMVLGGYSKQIMYDLIKEMKPDQNIVTSLISDAMKMNDTLLWDIMVPHAQLASFYRLTTMLKKSHPDWSKEKIGKYAADALNPFYGTMPDSWFPEIARNLGSVGFLAFKWTASNLDLIVKSLTFGKRGLGTRTMDNDEKRFIGKLNITYFFASLFMLLIAVNVSQLGLEAAKNKLIDLGVIKGDKVKLHTTFQNEIERNILNIFSVDSGTKNPKGQEQYYSFPLFRWVRDVFAWATSPRQTVVNKAEPLLKTTLEFLFNYSTWQHKPIVPEGYSTIEGLKKYVAYGLEALTPSQYFMPKNNKMETILPFFGAWVSSGAKGGKYTTLYYKYLNEKEANNDLIDQQIDNLLAQNKITEAEELMVSSGRYKTRHAIIDRILNYKIPIRRALMDKNYLRWLVSQGYTLDEIKEEYKKELKEANLTP